MAIPLCKALATSVVVTFLGICASLASAQSFDPQAIEFFEKEIRPLLVERCYKCHGDVETPKGDLKLTSRALLLAGGDSGPAAMPGKAKESLIVEAVEYRDSLQMPPDAKLNGRQIELISKWVALGLRWPDGQPAGAKSRQSADTYEFTDEQRAFWSFQPVRVVPPLEWNDNAWPRSQIDRYILAALEHAGLSPAATADNRVLIRRATFDLTGLAPTPDQIDAFLADDSPAAFARIVDRLLASPAYGERWGRHWLDVVRYADSKDLRDMGQPYDIVEPYRYRDWVVAALNRDLPYDQFVIDQIAGDLVPAREPGAVNVEGIVATGMLTIGPWGPGDADTQKMHTDMVDDQINVVSRAMLGLTIGCARCHDHKFDPIPTADYYSLAGIFFSTQIAVPQISAPYNKVPLVPQATLETVDRHMSRTVELEKEIKRYGDEQYAQVARSSLARTKEYLLAAWDYRHRAQDKAAHTPQQFADERQLWGDALEQWLDYLGLSSGDGRLMSSMLRDQPVSGVHGWRGNTNEPVLLGACLQMNTGEQAFCRPSMGAWLLYGLGSENQNLPGFVAISPNQPAQGAPLWGSAFLPAAYQGTYVADVDNPIGNLKNGRFPASTQREQLDLVKRLNELHRREHPHESELAARIASFELAFRMQAEAPEAFNIDAESGATKRIYGIDDKVTEIFGKQCLLARRLVERGVRFVQLFHTRSSKASACQLWDQHGGLKQVASCTFHPTRTLHATHSLSG